MKITIKNKKVEITKFEELNKSKNRLRNVYKKRERDTKIDAYINMAKGNKYKIKVQN